MDMPVLIPADSLEVDFRELREGVVPTRAMWWVRFVVK